MNDLTIGITYSIIAFIFYIILRYRVISKKNDDPIIVSLVLSIFWPCQLIICIFYYIIIIIESLLNKVYALQKLIKDKEIKLQNQ